MDPIAEDDATTATNDEPTAAAAVVPAPSSLSSPLPIECRKCHIKFKGKHELANHLDHFCANSPYADPEAFKQQLLLESGSALAAISFASVRDFINGAGPRGIGRVSLSEMRDQIRDDEAAMADVKGEVLRAREVDMLASLKQLRAKHSEAALRRRQEEARVQALIGDLDQRRTNELRARIETQRLKHALKRIDQTQLKSLEQEKRLELDELAKEQEHLRKRETDALDEIDRLVKTLDKDDASTPPRADPRDGASTAASDGAGAGLHDIRAQFAAKGRELGEQAAALRLSQERLAGERTAVLRKLEALAATHPAGSGEPVEADANALNDQQLDALVRRLRHDQDNEKAKLELLRTKLNAATEEQQQIIAGFDADAAQAMASTTPDTSDASATELAPFVGAPERAIPPPPPLEAPRPTDLAPDKPEPPAPSATKGRSGTTGEPGASARWRGRSPGQVVAAGRHDDVEPDDLPARVGRLKRSLLRELPDHVDREQVQATIELLEQQLLGRTGDRADRPANDGDRRRSRVASGSPPSLPPSPERRRSGSPSNGAHRRQATMHSPPRSAVAWDSDGASAARPSAELVVSPMLLQLQQQMAQTQQILQQHQSENSRLQQELGDIEMSNDVQRLDRQRRDFEQTLHLMTNKLSMHVGVGGNERAREFDKEDPSSDRPPADNRRPASMSLSDVPKDSELFKLELAHRTRLAQLRFKREIMAEEQELQQQADDLERRNQERDACMQHEAWLAEQNRLAEKQRLSQQIARDLPPESVLRLPGRAPYNPIDGFAILWDFVHGLEKSHPACKFVYQILDGSAPKTEVRSSNALETEPDGPSISSNRRCICGFVTPFPRMPPLVSLKLIVEVQIQLAPAPNAKGAPKIQSLGWGVLSLFAEGQELQSGHWKLPLYTGPMRKDASPDSLHRSFAQFRHPTAALFVRVVGSQRADPWPLQAGGDSDVVMHMYQVQGEPRAALGYASDAPDDASVADAGADSPLSMAEGAAGKPNWMPRLGRTGAGETIKPGAQVDANPDRSRESGAAADGDPAGNVDQSQPVQFGVSVHFCEHLCHSGYARVRVSVVMGEEQGRDLNDVPMRWTTPIAQIAANGGVGVFQWEKDNLFAPCRSNKPMRIVFELIEMKERPDPAVPVEWETGPKESAVGWTVLDAIKTSDLGLNVGPAILAFATYPVSWPFRPTPSIAESSLNVELFTKEKPPPVQDVRLLLDTSIDANMLSPWIDVEPLKPSEIQFEKGDGFDIYVDQCRYLPDNVTVCKVSLEVWTTDLGSMVGERSEAISQLDSRNTMPRFDLRREFRAHAFNPTCTIEIQVETIEQRTRRIKLLGIGVLNIFTGKGNRLQPAEAQMQDFALNDGRFQIPLHVMKVRPADAPFLAASYSSTPTLPCATILVRVHPAPKSDLGEVLTTETLPESEWVKQGLVVPATPYSRGQYESSRCRPATWERKIYNQKHENDGIVIRDLIDQIAAPSEDKADITTNDEALTGWMASKFVVPNRLPVPPRIDLKYLAKYTTLAGVRLAIDAADNVGDGRNLPFAIYSMSPPPMFYADSEFKVTDEVHITGQWDWDSTLRCPGFLNGFTQFTTDGGEFTIAIVDVRVAKRPTSDKVVIEPFGWTVLPLFCDNGYVRLGTYLLPLFKGSVLTDILEMMAKEPAADVIARETTAKANKDRKKSGKAPFEFMEPASVLVRLCDAQLGDILAPQRFHLRDLEIMYVDFDRRSNYDIDIDAAKKRVFFGLGGKPKLCSSVVPNNENNKQFETSIVKLIGKELGIESLNI